VFLPLCLTFVLFGVTGVDEGCPIGAIDLDGTFEIFT
jgi:hypothetical protein